MASPTSMPPNVHVSRHPCLQAKLSQLRSQNTQTRDVKHLVREISLIVGCEALASALTVGDGPMDRTPIGFEYKTTTIEPHNIFMVPILRAGLGMVEPIESLLPNPIPTHHLGLYREPTTLEPVEYYNNLPQQKPGSLLGPGATALILDPVIATGGTCCAAIQTLRQWGVSRIVVLSVIGAVEGVRRAAGEWAEGTEIWIGAVESEPLTTSGMLKPGIGDVGDRLYLTSRD